MQLTSSTKEKSWECDCISRSAESFGLGQQLAGVENELLLELLLGTCIEEKQLRHILVREAGESTACHSLCIASV
jgi:hypothetical protein